MVSPSRAASTRVVLELGSHGALVAALQRRLNDVLPFTHLALDGIYGPLTRGAVVNFQRQHNLDATGAVDVAHLGEPVQRSGGRHERGE